jgi:hypothetical protein
VDDQEELKKGMSPELLRMLTPEYKREAEEKERRMQETLESAERHLENARRLRALARRY